MSISGLVLSELAEKRYIARGAIILNIFLLWQVLLPIKAIDNTIILYLNLNIFFFLIALYSFLSIHLPQIDYRSLHPLFYRLSYGLYSSKTVLGFVIGSMWGLGFGGIVIISIIIWFLAINYLDHEVPFVSNT